MISFVVLAAATSLAAAPPCPGETTLEIDACFGQQLKAADRDLARYVAAARARPIGEAKSSDDPAGGAATLADFDQAEKAWATYRKAECDAVYAYWSDGTIRGSMELTCEIDLTRRHTHAVWRQWLTYMDDTPPILPEPRTN